MVPSDKVAPLWCDDNSGVEAFSYKHIFMIVLIQLLMGKD
uniref:Uncharacterized protein n=1 Tax=Vitis vinifera TaxID=29760 RepID=A5BN68_VITVI|nr:hypothetical protein VITISV_041348 [Vitis vinifera]